MSESMKLLRKAVLSFIGYAFGEKPLQAIYYLTYRCSSRCVYCDLWRRRAVDADPNDVIRNIKTLKRQGVQFISFTGGEPLLYPYLPEVLESAKRSEMRTTVITSGLSYLKRAFELKGLVDDLEFSLTTTNRESYKRERGVDCLSEVMQGIELAVSVGEPVSILATIEENNAHELHSLVEYARSQSVMCILGPVYQYFGNKAFPSKMAPILRSFSQEPGVWINRAFLEFMEQGGNQLNRPRCGALRTTLAISPEGFLLVPCFHHAVGAWKINGDLQAIYKSHRFSEERGRVGRYPFCQGCQIFCYFEGAFLRYPDRLLLLDATSRIRWLTQKTKLERNRRTGLM